MVCCLLSALLAGNLAGMGRIAWGLVRRPGPVLALALLTGSLLSLAIAPALAQHAGHYAARARDHHRSVVEEILAQPLCSGEAKS